MNDEFCGRKKVHLPIMDLCSDDYYAQELDYRNAESMNHSIYRRNCNLHFKLNRVEKYFQNIFNYRFTKN